MAKAAKHLSMTQPAVSDAIATLEDALQVQLLDRTSKGVEPTIYAEALLKRGHAIFDELRQGIRDIEFLADPTAGEVRIGCPESFAAGLVPAIIDRLTEYLVDIRASISRWCTLKRPRWSSGSCPSAESISSWEDYWGL